ncbi:ArgS-related anticodon-binding protein NrtL [Streptomyces sp. NPDC051452]|uniref:ArgS-related anticodon-binding protein NrtL n=1 Tax=Streptomyces sp. NPDC051452 TaxID=3365654 RepID=UPI0037B1A230
MTPVELSRTVLHAVRRAVVDGELRVDVPERAVVTEPGPGGCGDYSTNIALQLARPAGLPPRRVAEVLRARLLDADGIQDVVVTGPGFLNLRLDPRSDLVGDLVREIRGRGSAYGHGDSLAGQVVVLRVPHEVRAEAVAHAVARIVATQGGRVTVEHGEPADLRPVPAPGDPAPLGPDAAQWALLHPAPHDRPRISADHLVQRESNPLFRVRYAHARIRSLGRNAVRLGFSAEPGPVDGGQGQAPASGPVPADPLGFSAEPGPVDSGQGQAPLHSGQGQALVANGQGQAPVANGQGQAPASRPAPADPPGLSAEPGLLKSGQGHPSDPDPDPGPDPDPDPGLAALLPPLLTPLADYPRILAAAATHRAPDRLARHLVTLADAVLPLLPSVLPVGEEKPSAAHRARLALAEAAGTVLAGGLSLLGIDAPEHL